MISRYSRPAAVAIWSQETKYRIWFEIEAHAATKMAELGVIPTEAAEAIWAKGIHGVPTRIRVRFARQRNDDENAKHKLYTIASYVPVASFKGLQTENIDE